MVGYALCLGVLYVRQRVAAIREAEAERRASQR